MARGFFVLVGCASLLLAGCGDVAEEVAAPVRAVKLFEVAENAGGETRKFSGKIIAANSANLSFPVSGTIETISVEIGDSVVLGQALAKLDTEPFQLDVDAAQAELGKAKAAAAEKTEEYKRSKQLFSKGWVSKAALEQAQFARQTAMSEVSFKNTRLNQAKRTLGDAILKAPYSGIIGERFVEPNEEVASGKEIMTLDADGTLEISISVPEKAISKLKMGMTANASFSVLPDVIVEGHVTEISRVAGSGNIFPVKVSLVNPPPTLRAGMSGEVSLTTEINSQENGFLLPLSALSAEGSLKGSFVFVFDPSTLAIAKVTIEPETVRGNMVAVKGVHSGDLVVSAGVSFLSDGQKVKRMVPAAN